MKNFIIQTGDPTGTGMGGESIYGEPFMDEIHSRLKFNRRGLVGMANNSKRHTNNSQWFITLDRADELNGRHTLFGRIQGPTYYSACASLVVRSHQMSLTSVTLTLMPRRSL